MANREQRIKVPTERCLTGDCLILIPYSGEDVVILA